MTVNTINITSGPYVGNGLSDTYSYTFRVNDKTQLSVYETDDNGNQTLLTVDTDYTVTGIGVDAGGTVVRTAGNLPTDYEWYIRSNYVENQLTAFPSQGPFFPDVHEAQFDHLTFLVQQLRDTLDRSFRLSDSIDVDGAFTLLQDAASRAGQFLAFDASGNIVISTGTGADAGLRTDLADTSDLGKGAALVGQIIQVITLKSNAKSLTPVSTRQLWMDGSYWYAVTGGSGLADDSINGYGTIIIPTGGDGTTAWLRDYDGPLNADWYDLPNSGYNTAVQEAHDALPATGGAIFIEKAGTVTVDDEVDITTDNVRVIIAKGTTLDMSTISGTGTSNVRATADVISAFKVTSDNVVIQIDGVIYTNNDAVGGKNVTAILPYACDKCHVTGSGKIQGHYCGVWPAKGTTAFKCTINHLTGCIFNIGLGSDGAVAVNPEVTGVEIEIGISDNAQSDGIKAISHTFNVSIRGGLHKDHTRDAIDLYVGGERVSVVGTQCFNNGFHGIDMKYGADTTGAGGNDAGFNRAVTVQGNVCSGNTAFGISITDELNDGATDFSVSGNISTNNTDSGFRLTGAGLIIANNVASNNGTYGYECQRLLDSVLSKNTARNNGTGLSEQKGFFFANVAAAKCSGLTVVGNVAIGDITNQVIGFDARSANIENSVFTANRSEGHGANNWQIDTAYTNEDVHFDRNAGLVTLNRGNFSSTTTGAGELTLNHGLHTTPKTVLAQVEGNNNYYAHVHTIGTTQFRVTVRNDAGVTVNSTAVTIHWQASTFGVIV
jgi:hypothetical protein